MDYYKILNIPQQADESQIKQAYRKLAKRYHPDLNPDNPEAEARFKDIVEAYETLSDPAKRRKYDANMIHSSDTMESDTKAQDTVRSAGATQGVNFGNFTRDMERYFGFSFQANQQGGKQNPGNTVNKNKKNPLDVTDMFEAFMKIK
ncbi:MAG: DnaJ domain-containing protein [Lachnospiraceae bacterium]|nr:DnaJ domain-containing protein [Lachnospiraceae bacterium]